MTTSDATIVAVGASREGGGELTAAEHECGSCGAHSPSAGPFCSRCGARLAPATHTSEYKQVTVLFADVVRSMDIAATVDIERLRDVMTAVVERSAAVVQRYGGTVDYNGDGVMAVFGAPKALEDHAFRACASALAIQDAMAELASEVQRRDGVTLQVRVGLNSGRVIAGDLGSGMLGYAATGSPVGVAQRIESAAPAGGVMLSESTARLVEHTASLGELEWVSIKGSDQPVRAYRLVGIKPRDGLRARAEARLVGRSWEMAALDAVVDRAIDGHGSVVEVVGSPGIGKSRTAREIAASAAARGVDVFWAFCESHASDIPFHAVAGLLRATTGVAGLGSDTARTRVRERFPHADPEDLLLLDELLGIADPAVPRPAIAADARRRRLTALIKGASRARTRPAMFIIEDAHWVDTVSESLIADFLSVVPHTASAVAITYRPEYQGALTRLPASQRIALGPLGDSDIADLLEELLGPDPSVRELAAIITQRAAGNPFFAEEMVHELAQRAVLDGDSGSYVSHVRAADVAVPGTVQAAIEARIDRLGTQAKRTLNAASVIGARFSTELLTAVGIEAAVDQLLDVELIERIGPMSNAEYAFRHPLILAVAYESQLKSDRAEWHRRLAAAIQTRDPSSVEENAALIAEHLEAASDLPAAYDWQMRAAEWSTNRDLVAARRCWERATGIADALSADTADRMSMRIKPRAMLCATDWQAREVQESRSRFEELQQLCGTTGDTVSLAIAMTGLATELLYAERVAEGARLSSRQMALLATIDDPAPAMGLAAIALCNWHGVCEFGEVLRWAQRIADVAAGDPVKGAGYGFGSPLAIALAWRGTARWCLGEEGWGPDLHQAVALARRANAETLSAAIAWSYGFAMQCAVFHVDDTLVTACEEAVEIAEKASSDRAVGLAAYTLGVALLHSDSVADRDRGLRSMAKARDVWQRKRALFLLPAADVWTAREMAKRGNLEAAVDTLREAVGRLRRGYPFYGVWATGVLVETLLERGEVADIDEAGEAVRRLSNEPVAQGSVLLDITLLRLRTLLARAHGETDAYADLAARYLARAESLGFEGHIAWARALAER
ncbi:adenylate/guanylate cyclase domain-containing protein [Mycobacterium sp. M26]|uniref:ATP-binding protein n=1 Tax=Mycobacterium sp. M26 TaxID=1762962 RepID=UPI000AE1DE76|nr:adenylate/guanylate cyclase domain-containing protein [Mycobacterium sp. M26]